ncbi:unnamed protein product [Euphydryas editha]|uniref:Uncharacterized protein n=1 Tax=Euphydryas editha TaxID=104508 RepID=A0AAU9UY68_EUPED|nr:unnamed protein product [Euphydryas editha]
MNIILLFVLCVGITSAKPMIQYLLRNAPDHFEDFIKTYNKEYDETEKAIRYGIFVKNLENINILNQKSNDTTFDINKFSDLSTEEFIQRYTGYRHSNVSNYCINSDQLDLKPVDVPEEFDWRQKGVVTRVKNQMCNSCWAFSATGTVESAYAIKTRQQVVLAEQQLIDCDKQSDGCNGGYPIKALKYFQDNGAMTEDDYPYEAKNGQCRFNSQKVKAKVKNCVLVQGNEDGFVEKLLQIGPLSIALDAEPVQHYKGGIMKTDCQGTKVNHAVLLVGYGKGEDGTPYWLIKNSWGADWGEKGYFRIHRGVNCVLVADTTPAGVVIE